MEIPGQNGVSDGNRESNPPNVFPWGNPAQQIRAPTFAPLRRSSLPPRPPPLNPMAQNILVTEMVRQQHEANYRRVLMSCPAARPAPNHHLPSPTHAVVHSNCTVLNYSHTGTNLAPFTLFPMWFSTYPRAEIMPQGNWYTCPCLTSSYWFATGTPATSTMFDSRMNAAAPSMAGAYVPPSFHANPMPHARPINGGNSNVRYYEVKKSTGTSRNKAGSGSKKAKESTKEEEKKGIQETKKAKSSTPGAVEKEGEEEATEEGFVLLDSNARSA